MATVQTDQTKEEWDEWTKPPFLRRVRIRGYKSIAFCDVELKPLTILVGRNASGKSNFLDALAFMRDTMETNVSEAIRRRGGWSSVACRTLPTQQIEIEIEAGFTSDNPFRHISRNNSSVSPPSVEALPSLEDKYVTAKYRLQSTSEAGSLSVISSESLEIISGGNDWKGEFENHRTHGIRSGNSNFHPDILPEFSKLLAVSYDDRPLLGLIGTQPFIDLANSVRNMGFYNFHPDTIRRLAKPQPGSLLDRDGSNLASVLDSLKKINPDTVQRLREYLSLITEEVQHFDPVRYGEYETVRFHLRSASKDKPLEFDAASMSDGTLRALASLVAAFQIHLPTGPSVVGIEEPETALHPAASRALVAALDEATARTQIVLTTHSADLLADRDIRPSQLLIVRNQHGQSQIAPVDQASREIIHKELYTLADLHRQDHLQPDWADLQRQENLARANGEG